MGSTRPDPKLLSWIQAKLTRVDLCMNIAFSGTFTVADYIALLKRTPHKATLKLQVMPDPEQNDHVFKILNKSRGLIVYDMEAFSTWLYLDNIQGYGGYFSKGNRYGKNEDCPAVRGAAAGNGKAFPAKATVDPSFHNRTKIR